MRTVSCLNAPCRSRFINAVFIIVFCIWGGVNCPLWGQSVGELFFDLPATPVQGTDTIQNPFGIVIFDDHGQYYSLEDVVPKQQPLVCSTPNVIVNFYFEDPAGEGFDDPANADAINVLCEVVNYLFTQVITVPSNFCTNELPELNIKVDVSENNPSLNMLAAARQYYYNYAQNNLGVVHNSAWRLLTTGTDPLDFPLYNFSGSSAYHGAIKVNFGHAYNYNSSLPNGGFPGQTDFYSVILHELMHMLGFASMLTDASGTGSLTSGQIYGNYDKHLSFAMGPMILPNSCGWAYNNAIAASMLDQSCNALNFTGTAAGSVPIFITNDGTYQFGTTYSHLHDACVGSVNDYYFVMRPSIANNVAIRTLSTEEINIMCDLGYDVNCTYNNIASGVDDPQAGCAEIFEVSACPGVILTIPLSSLRGNDNNLMSLDCFQTELGGGSVQISGSGNSLIFSAQGNAGWHIVSYIGSNGNAVLSNTTFIYINATYCAYSPFPCNQAEDMTNGTCNLICNPDMYDEDCNFRSQIFDNCSSFGGWGDVVPTPDYISGDDAPIGEGALGIGVTNEGNIEALGTGIHLEPGTEYILSYVRKSPLSITVPQSPNSPWTPAYLADAFRIIAVDQVSTITSVGISPTDPAMLDMINNSFPILTDTEFPDENWRQAITCVTIPEDIPIDINALVMWTVSNQPPQTTGEGLAYVAIDQFDVIEDVFIDDHSIVSACGTDVLIGTDLCTDLLNLQYTWEVSTDAGLTWTSVPEWNNYTQISVSPAQTTLYRITRSIDTEDHTYEVVNAECVFKQATIQVLVPLQSEVNLGPDQSICVGESATLTATGGINCTWSNGAIGNPIVVSPTTTTTYTVIATDANGCISTDVINVIVHPNFTPSMTGLEAEYCAADPINVSVSPPGGMLVITDNAGNVLTSCSPAPCQVVAPFTTPSLTSDTYNITYTATDLYGCTGSITQAFDTKNCTDLCVGGNSNTYVSFGGSPDYTAPTTSIWQNTTAPGANHPLGAAQGTQSSPIRINGEITIPPGVTVTMRKLYIEFGPLGRITVQQGGTLYIEGSTLTHDPICNTMWQGIRVYGPGDNGVISATNRGRVVFPNYYMPSTIKGAIVGIATTHLPKFDINQVAMQVSTLNEIENSYTNPSSATILSAIFNNPAEVTAAFALSGGDIVMNNPSASRFHDCFYGIFVPFNSIINAYDLQYADIVSNPSLPYPFQGFRTEAGIAGLFLPNTTLGVQNSNFQSLGYGVRSNFVNTVRVNNCTINTCKRGISLRNFMTNAQGFSSILNSQIDHCNIGIQADGVMLGITQNVITGDYQPGLYNSAGQDIGIFLRSSDFNVGPTTFTSSNAGNSIGGVDIGVISVESDITGNVIRNNVIDQTVLGVCVLGTNNNLQITCNDITNYLLSGIFLAYDSTNGIVTLPEQGICDPLNPNLSQPAANLLQSGSSFPDIYRELSNANSLPFLYNEAPQLLTGVTANDPGIINACDVFNGWTREGQCSLIGQKPAEIVIDIEDPKEKDYWANLLIRQYKENQQNDSAVYLLQAIQTQMADRKLVEEYYFKGQTANASLLLDGLSRIRPEDQDYYDLFKLLLTLKSEGRNLFNITPDEEATLLAIATHETHTAYRVQTLLYVIRGYEFPVFLPNFSDQLQGAYTVFKAGNVNVLSVSKLIPNPAQNIAYFQHNLAEEQQAKLSIYSIEGQLLRTVQVNGKGTEELMLENLSEGLYLYTITIGDEVVSREKLVIVK